MRTTRKINQFIVFSMKLTKGNLTCGARNPASQHLTNRSTHTHIITFLDSFNRTQGLCNTMGLVGELKEKLGANRITAQRRPNRALRPSNRATRTLDDKVIQILPSHELEDLSAECGLALANGFDLRLKCTDLIIGSNPLTERIP